MREILLAGIPINSNLEKQGIPQGTPISAVLSNLYMADFDLAMQSWCKEHFALYRRYSDDILIICRSDLSEKAETALKQYISDEKLEINDSKTERRIFDSDQTTNPQYLGFDLSPEGAVIRPSSLSRQWRKLRRGIRRIRRIGEIAIARGDADRIFTKKLRRRFTALRVRNFSSYARRSAASLGSSRILRQTRRMERFAEREIGALKSHKPPKSPV
jgi:RNA-directed DNA polymerase